MRRRLFLGLVAVHAAFLLGWAGWIERDRASSPMVRLDVVQRDPRDLLRGDYVTLRYAISWVPLGVYSGTVPPRTGDSLWVLLEPEGESWRAVRAAPAREALAPAPAQRVIVGTVRGWQAGRGVDLEYGIERYYVPEGRGTPPRGRMQADVVLTADGRAHLLRLLVDGRPYP